MTNNGGPAFPVESGYDYRGERVVTASQGMTLRDWFAGQALAGIVDRILVEPEMMWANAASLCYAAADAMLAERAAE